MKSWSLGQWLCVFLLVCLGMYIYRARSLSPSLPPSSTPAPPSLISLSRSHLSAFSTKPWTSMRVDTPILTVCAIRCARCGESNRCPRQSTKPTSKPASSCKGDVIIVINLLAVAMPQLHRSSTKGPCQILSTLIFGANKQLLHAHGAIKKRWGRHGMRPPLRAFFLAFFLLLGLLVVACASCERCPRARNGEKCAKNCAKNVEHALAPAEFVPKETHVAPACGPQVISRGTSSYPVELVPKR